jgi:hypothetical protein
MVNGELGLTDASAVRHDIQYTAQLEAALERGGRMAVYDPQHRVSTDFEDAITSERNILYDLRSVQGYSSVVDGHYESRTGAHTLRHGSTKEPHESWPAGRQRSNERFARERRSRTRRSASSPHASSSTSSSVNAASPTAARASSACWSCVGEQEDAENLEGAIRSRNSRGRCASACDRLISSDEWTRTASRFC